MYYRYYCTVMSDQLPELIDPVVFAERQSHLLGHLGVRRLDRLADFLFDNKGELQIDLQFYKEGKVPVIEGRIEGHLFLTCQNCLQALEWTVSKPVRIGMVQTIEQADRLSDGLEPLMVTGNKMSLPGIVEDEVLISLPDYPRHEHKCLQYQPAEKPVESREIEAQPDNPFAVLATLKINGDR